MPPQHDLEIRPAPSASGDGAPAGGGSLLAELAREGSLDFGFVKFEGSSAKLRPESQRALQQVGVALAPYDDVPLEIVVAGGFEGPERGLWDARAEAVRSFLLQQPGMRGQEIRVRGFGETTPTPPLGNMPSHLVLRVVDPDELRREINR